MPRTICSLQLKNITVLPHLKYSACGRKKIMCSNMALVVLNSSVRPMVLLTNHEFFTPNNSVVNLTSLEFTRGTASKMNSIAALLPKISFPPDAPSVNYIDRFDLSLRQTLSFSEAEFTRETTSKISFPPCGPSVKTQNSLLSRVLNANFLSKAQPPNL
ncbi:hypothetical protein TNCV_3756381 [Trichonephila clavipes]|nr:hypothetical protein TNCV_3756381 [Trichonephila clavipes]